MVLSDEVASALAPFFDKIGPSHDELTTLIRRAGLADLDPGSQSQTPLGKMRRVRGVLFAAVEHRPKGGEKLVKALIDAVRANGGFRPDNPNYPGINVVEALRAALRTEGVQLDPDGRIFPIHMESLEGRELTAALRAYVRRVRRGGWDPAVVLGSAKSLEEAAARHVIKEHTGTYPTHADLPTTLYQAFNILGLSAPKKAVLDAIPLMSNCVV